MISNIDKKSKDRPKISVIIPAWNEEKYLPQCLDHVLNQNFSEPYEIIVVNNNSSDNTHEIAKNMGVRVIDESRQGISITKNAGAKVARGEILSFIDADCLVPRDYLQKINKIFSSNPNLAIVGGPYVYYDAPGVIKFITDRLNYFYWFLKGIKLFFGFQSFAGANMAVRKKMFNEVRGFDERIKFPEDLEFSKRVSRRGYKMFFTNDLRISCSFRRAAKSPIKETVKRMVLMMKVLLDNSR